MQVLIWQDNMLRKPGMGYDELDVNLNASEIDPVTPDSTLAEMSPAVAAPGAGPPEAGIVLAGFRDCSEEAVRYLVEVEHLDEDDPLVVGLRKHLWERQQYLDVPRLLKEQGCGCSWGQEEQEGYHHRNYQNHQHHPHRTGGGGDQNAQGVFTNLRNHQLTEEARWRLQEGAADTTPTASSNVEGAGIDLDIGLDQHSNTSSGSAHTQSQCQGQATDLSVLDLALLAQNNPAIASLTEEILSLLGAGEDSDLDESDLDLDIMDHSSD